MNILESIKGILLGKKGRIASGQRRAWNLIGHQENDLSVVLTMKKKATSLIVVVINSMENSAS